jgi:outer membrane protein assembly factor BamD
MGKIFYCFTVLLFLIGCSSKNSDYNKSAVFWYNEIVNSIAISNFDRADEHFASLHSEHIRSELIEPATLLLINSHIKNKKYIMANFYIDLYQKKYGHIDNQEFAEYLKLKSNYMGLGKAKRQQKLLIDTLDDSENFYYNYDKSEFKPFVVSMIESMKLGLYTLNEHISSLYQRVDKPKASLFYKQKNEDLK